MIDPLDFQNRPFLSILQRKRRLCALVLFIENASKALWRITAWCAFFAGLWLMQIASVVEQFGPPALALCFFAGLGYFIKKDIGCLRIPTRNDVDRRLEIESVLGHRPISAIEDKLVNPEKEPTRKMWQKNQDDALAKLASLRVPLPRSLLSGNDYMAFRSLAALVLIVGIVAAGPQWQERLRYGLFPFSFNPKEEQKGANVTLWITPPDYTAMARIILQGNGHSGETLGIPEGSILKIRVNEGLTTPLLTMAGKEIALDKLGESNWGIETLIPQGERIALKQWPFTKADIPYTYIVDQPPQITMAGAPEELGKGETKLPIKVVDDYGVTDMTLRMTLDTDMDDKPLGGPYQETRAVMSPPNTEMELNPVYDLSWHPWAGLPVKLDIEGEDFPGQKSAVIPLHMTLPERPFTHPVAKQLTALRKRLIWTPGAAAENVAYDLETLLQEPGKFQNDLVTFLAIRSASSRLAYGADGNGISRVIELLWDTALRIEDGNLPIAARNLRDAQRNLEQTLRDPDATDEEIAKALQELREAMAAYFQEMYRELQKRMAENGQPMQIPPEMFQSMVQPEDMASFLDKLQAEALSGDRDSARELLSQLQQFMDMLDPSMDMAMPPQMEFMMEGISELQELIEKQQGLMDQTQRQADLQNGRAQQEYPEAMPLDKDILEKWGMGDMPPPPAPDQRHDKTAPQIDTQNNKTEQDALRYVLGQLMIETDEMLGEIPENMQLAEQDMRNSAEELGDNNPAASLPHQAQAIEHLQDAMQGMGKQMQQMMQSMTILSFGGGMQQLDPLGRPMMDGDQQGLFPGSRVEIPDEAERKRVQEILNILRQRSGEISRPDYELEYYRRLMKKF